MNETNVPAGMKVLASRARTIAEEQKTRAHQRIVLAVIGKDRPGILAGVTAILAQRHANIVDVSQTIMSELFTMVMLVEIDRLSVSFAEIKREMEEHGKREGLSILLQHEDIFRAMHRI